ncbi:MAG: hypothetical protein AB9869_35175 [Verrucomicrobiia bacterium]
MNPHPVVRSGGEVVAYVKEIGNREELIAKGGRLVAVYDEQRNQTILSGGRLYGLGNQLLTLIDQSDE